MQIKMIYNLFLSIILSIITINKVNCALKYNDNDNASFVCPCYFLFQLEFY